MPKKETITSLILCGGRGTRLKGLFPDVPKPLIPVSGRPFVAWLCLWLAKQGMNDFVFAAGHLAEAVEEWAATAPLPGATMRVSREMEPLGTGGALVQALDLCGEAVLALNGDSMLLFDFAPMLQSLEAGADAVLAGVYRDDCARYGSLRVGPGGFLEGFVEKQPGAGLINGGIYLFRKDLMAAFPRGQAMSIECDVWPRLLRAGAKIAVHKVEKAPFLDIGLPETLAQAEEFVAKNKEWFLTG